MEHGGRAMITFATSQRDEEHDKLLVEILRVTSVSAEELRVNEGEVACARFYTDLVQLALAELGLLKDSASFTPAPATRLFFSNEILRVLVPFPPGIEAERRVLLGRLLALELLPKMLGGDVRRARVHAARLARELSKDQPHDQLSLFEAEP